ncbi:hypothetical protein WA026_000923 [Henosepilachna vigintioctopunctata]|uniref:Uncharacterized protein n=1 Tax=Henosepilachna vigintioctopunctata TaxID=420089 RepID=A0AAW1V037_9CUCU
MDNNPNTETANLISLNEGTTDNYTSSGHHRWDPKTPNRIKSDEVAEFGPRDEEFANDDDRGRF